VSSAALSWVKIGWREPLFWRRFVVNVLLACVPAAACFAIGWGVPGLVLFAVGAWPWPVQVSVGRDGVRLRWLFLRESWPAESIMGLRVQTDPRRWAWPRRKVLIIERRNHRASFVFGPEEMLSRLAAAA
jgi:hypothetical protein